MSDEFFSSFDDEFDIAALTQHDVTHAQIVGKTILILDMKAVSSRYGAAFLIKGLPIENAESFKEQPQQILIGATVLVQALMMLDNAVGKCFTVGKAINRSQTQEYYEFVRTPDKIRKLISNHPLPDFSSDKEQTS